MKASQLRTRSIGYNAYGEQETDTLLADEVTHLITETRDALGRATGFIYAKNGTVQQTVTTGYGTDGRIATAGFLHGGIEKQFGYSYLPGSNLLQTLTMPCNMTLTQSYETRRDLLIGMSYHRGSTLVTQRTYTYDTLGRPLTRSTTRNRQTINDSFGYNNRSELTTATVSNGSYAYDYDNIGNRKTAQENTEEITGYQANALNQYAMLSVDDIADFIPSYDAAGNQTRVKTSTGIWAISYDAENRPTDFTSQAVDGTITTVHCEYDYMGRRATKQVTTNGSITLHQRYIYRGYLQIAALDLTRAAHPALWYITWDPTQPIATRPLAIQKDGTWYTYGWDLTKNICEVFGPAGYIRTNYSYSPYGEVTISGDVTQPIQWSSEYNDAELDLVYYNYRHYNPMDGRWLGRDSMMESSLINLYMYAYSPIISYDYLGLGVYVKGDPKQPSIQFGKEDYPYDATIEPGWRDILSYVKWVSIDVLANLIPYNLRDTGEYILDAANIYDHYMGGSGRDYVVDYVSAYNSDSAIKSFVDNEVRTAQLQSEQLWDRKDVNAFSITGTAQPSTGYYPVTENWQKTLGFHYIWGAGTVTPCVGGDANIMRLSITVRAIDRYDFNKDAYDIASGYPDSINGRFAQLGWARAFMTHGRIDFDVEWRIGSVEQTSVVTITSNR